MLGVQGFGGNTGTGNWISTVTYGTVQRFVNDYLMIVIMIMIIIWIFYLGMDMEMMRYNTPNG